MNYLNQKLKSIQTSKAVLYKELENETNPHIQQKIEHQIDSLSKEEKETLDQLNLRLDDIILTDEKPPLEEEEE